ncbi:hypothetical protein [Nocardia sp. R7R-8]|uniref:hypothetical protein n=1 Tax=Nocardia sp. R7R-8 TaxID=3459304 RepID=UPI00403DFCB1
MLFRPRLAAFGVFVDERRCWVGNENGDVFTVTPDGVVAGRKCACESIAGTG